MCRKILLKQEFLLNESRKLTNTYTLKKIETEQFAAENALQVITFLICK